MCAKGLSETLRMMMHPSAGGHWYDVWRHWAPYVFLPTIAIATINQVKYLNKASIHHTPHATMHVHACTRMHVTSMCLTSHARTLLARTQVARMHVANMHVAHMHVESAYIQAMAKYGASEVVPVYYCLFTLSCITAGMFMYKEVNASKLLCCGFSYAEGSCQTSCAWTWVLFVMGISMTFFGVYLITSQRKKGEEQDEDKDDRVATVLPIRPLRAARGIMWQISWRERRSTPHSWGAHICIYALVHSPTLASHAFGFHSSAHTRRRAPFLGTYPCRMHYEYVHRRETKARTNTSHRYVRLCREGEGDGTGQREGGRDRRMHDACMHEHRQGPKRSNLLCA